jgi:hypothetical protein
MPESDDKKISTTTYNSDIRLVGPHLRHPAPPPVRRILIALSKTPRWNGMMVSYRTTREAGTRLTFSHLSPSAGLSYSPKPRPALARSLLRGKVPPRRSCCEAQCQTQETTGDARGYGVLWEEMQQFTVSSGRGSRHEKACKGISVRFVPAPRLGPPLPKRSAGRGGKASQGPGEECELPVCPGGSGCATRRLGSASLGRRASAEREDIALEEHGRSAARTAGPDAC